MRPSNSSTHCQRAGAQRKPRRKGKLALGPKPDKWGDSTTGDHLISRKSEGEIQLEADDNESLLNDLEDVETLLDDVVSLVDPERTPHSTLANVSLEAA